MCFYLIHTWKKHEWAHRFRRHILVHKTACTNPGKWAVINLCARGIDSASFYEFSIGFSKFVDRMVCFVFHFICQINVISMSISFHFFETSQGKLNPQLLWLDHVFTSSYPEQLVRKLKSVYLKADKCRGNIKLLLLQSWNEKQNYYTVGTVCKI